jgi:hypothetical protein
LIQRLAEPLLNSKIGKAAVEVMKTASKYVTDACFMAVDAAEWVIDKGCKAINFISEKATDITNRMGETAVVKGAIGLGKDLGEFITSSNLWKSAAEMAIFIYTKMSNFCTAVVESYLYYNQCRTMARRIVVDKYELADEHTILKTFHEVSKQEAKANTDHEKTDEVRSF